MKPLPSPDGLASLVSQVTDTMLGISFVPDDRASLSEDLRWKTALLPIPGLRPLTVGLSSDRVGCAALSAAMFSVTAAEVDMEMMDDSLRELVNMTAGLLKTALVLDQSLGLPKVFASDQIPGSLGAPCGHTLVLKARDLGLVLWVNEGIDAQLHGGS
jgi:hypothetical protein